MAIALRTTLLGDIFVVERHALVGWEHADGVPLIAALVALPELDGRAIFHRPADLTFEPGVDRKREDLPEVATEQLALRKTRHRRAGRVDEHIRPIAIDDEHAVRDLVEERGADDPRPVRAIARNAHDDLGDSGVNSPKASGPDSAVILRCSCRHRHGSVTAA